MNTRRNDVFVVLIIVAAVGLLHLAGVTCVIKFTTGVSCPGCGMTRAWLSLLRLDVPAAFAYHPLFWLPPLMVLGYFLRHRLGKKAVTALVILCGVLFCGVYAYRMLSGCAPDIVAFTPMQGIVAKTLKWAVSLLT